MKHLERVRLSIYRSSSGTHRNVPTAVATITEKGFGVQLGFYGSEETSFEDLFKALAEHRTDCCLIPGRTLPQVLIDGISLSAVLPRRSARLFLVAAEKHLHRTPVDPIGLPPAATVAVPFVGQRAQLLAVNPDLKIADLTSVPEALLSAVRNHTVEAALIPADEIEHCDLAGMALSSLGPEVMLPPPGLGTTVVVTRSDDPLGEELATLDHLESNQCFSAERALAKALDWPPGLACLATPETDGGIRLQASMAGPACDPRSALARVGAVAPTPQAAAELCVLALQECVRNQGKRTLRRGLKAPEAKENGPAS